MRENPLWSPDGKSLPVRRGEDLWLAPVDLGGLRLLVRRAGDAAWAPDGGQIAFTRMNDGRDPHFTVHILDLASGPDREVCSGLEVDWVSDGSRVLCAARLDEGG